MDFSVIEAKAKRQRLAELAGQHYRDASSSIVKRLSGDERKAYFGIENDRGQSTILGSHCVFVRTVEGETIELSHSDFTAALHANGMKLGKRADMEFVPLGNDRTAWLKDAQTMCALWSIAERIAQLQQKDQAIVHEGTAKAS